jgi:hypothetical protein
MSEENAADKAVERNQEPANVDAIVTARGSAADDMARVRDQPRPWVLMIYLGGARWTRTQLLGELDHGGWGMSKGRLTDVFGTGGELLSAVETGPSWGRESACTARSAQRTGWCTQR